MAAEIILGEAYEMKRFNILIDLRVKSMVI
jgi:hypothetical protein